MIRVFSFALITLACTLRAHASIDFSPVTSERKLSGFTFQQLNFSHNGRRVTYEQPPGWSYSGGGPRIKFVPPSVTLAHSEIDQMPLSAPITLDEDTKKVLQQRALASVPPDSQDVVLVAEMPDPVLVNNNHTYEVTVAYKAFGQEFMTGIVYLNLPDTQVRFRTVARKEDFEKLHNAFRGSIFSWQWQ